MKTQTFIVEIEMPDGDYIGASILQDDIQGFCDVEEEGRQKVTVKEFGGHAEPPGEKGVDGSQYLPGIENEEPGVAGRDYVPVDWVETLDMYGKWEIIRVAKADLEKEDIIGYANRRLFYDKDFDGYGHSKLRPVITREELVSLARHFYELGKQAKKEGLKGTYEENVGVKESPLKTFPRTNEFDTGSSYRR